MSKWVDRTPPLTPEQQANRDAGLWKDGRMPDRLCTARRTNGDPCKRPPIAGASVCRTHGGAAPHVKKAAKARLENASDRLARQLLGMAEDESLKPETRLAALKDALDRAGLSPRQAVDVTHELKRYEQVFEGIDRGMGDYGGPPTVVDGEVVPAEWGEFGDGREA